MKTQKEEYNNAKKLSKIYNTIGFSLFIALILSIALFIWFPIFGKVVLTIIVLFTGVLVLYAIGPHAVMEQIEKTGYKDKNN